MSMCSDKSISTKKQKDNFDIDINDVLNVIFKKLGIYNIYKKNLSDLMKFDNNVHKHGDVNTEKSSSMNFDNHKLQNSKNTKMPENKFLKQSLNISNSIVSSFKSKISANSNYDISDDNKLSTPNIMKMITTFLSKYSASFMTIEPYVYQVKDDNLNDLSLFINNYKFWLMIISFFIAENFCFEDIINLINYAIETCKKKSGKVKIFEFFLIILSSNLIDIEELEYCSLSKQITYFYKKYKNILNEISTEENDIISQNDYSSIEHSDYRHKSINFKHSNKGESEKSLQNNEELKDYLTSSEKQTPKKLNEQFETPGFNYNINNENCKGIYNIIDSSMSKSKRMNEKSNFNFNFTSPFCNKNQCTLDLKENKITSEYKTTFELTSKSNITSSEYSVINENDLNFFKHTDTENSFNIENYINDYTKLEENEILIEESDFLSKGCFAIFKINNPIISEKLYGKKYIFSPLKKFKSREDRISARLSVKIIMEKYPDSVYVPFNLVLFNIAMNE